MTFALIGIIGTLVAIYYSRDFVMDYRQEHPMFSKKEDDGSIDALAFVGHPPRPNPAEIKANPYN